jgi:hypothetical protein
VFLKPVNKRRITTIRLTVMRKMPVPRMAGCKVGPPSKSGGPPFGFGARAMVDGSCAMVMQVLICQTSTDDGWTVLERKVVKRQRLKLQINFGSNRECVSRPIILPFSDV